MMTATCRPVGVLPVGNIPAAVAKIIAAHISGYLGLTADVLQPMPVPEYAFDRHRRQYDAGKILARLDPEPFSEFEKVVAVFGVDLCIPIFSFVFGEAKLGGKFALVSVYRLDKQADGSVASTAVFYERAAKIALHEIGHLFHLFHCDDRRCLMHFTGDLADLDRAPLYYCRYCTRYLKDALGAVEKG